MTIDDTLMPLITNLGTNSLSTVDWLSVSQHFHIVDYRPEDLMSSFTANPCPILNQEPSPEPPRS
jgi:hypothetical protein